MARIVGRRGGLWALGLLGLLILAPLTVFFPLTIFSPLGGALALGVAGSVAALLAHRRATTLAARCEKLSDELGVVSQRLLRLEAASRTADERSQRSEADRTAGQSAESASLAANVEEVTAEIGLLSGIVRELAGVVAAQDGDIARLKAEPRPSPPVRAPAPLPAPEIVVPPRYAAIASTAAPVPWTPRPLDAGPAKDAPAQNPERRDTEREAAMLAALDAGGLEVYLQPVVSLPQRKVVSYEALARLRLDGDTVSPDLFLPVLERHGRTTDLDRRMLQRVATIGRHLQGRGSAAQVAYALSPLSLFEPGFLRWLARLLADEPGLAGRLVVALPQASWRNLDAEQAGALASLRGQVGFTLDRPIDLRLDPLALADHGVGQVKVPADLLLRPGSRQAMPDIALDDLVASLARAGIRLVADRVEREADVPDLIDLDVPLAQGTIFAPARAVRAEVLAAPEPEAPAPPVVDEPEPPPQRRPFRDFLRRAG